MREPRVSLTITLTFDELDAIVEAAHGHGVSTEEFVKRLVSDGLHPART